jgi:hypothetical protein
MFRWLGWVSFGSSALEHALNDLRVELAHERLQHGGGWWLDARFRGRATLLLVQHAWSLASESVKRALAGLRH